MNRNALIAVFVVCATALFLGRYALAPSHDLGTVYMLDRWTGAVVRLNHIDMRRLKVLPRDDPPREP